MGRAPHSDAERVDDDGSATADAVDRTAHIAPDSADADTRTTNADTTDADATDTDRPGHRGARDWCGDATARSADHGFRRPGIDGDEAEHRQGESGENKARRENTIGHDKPPFDLSGVVLRMSEAAPAVAGSQLRAANPLASSLNAGCRQREYSGSLSSARSRLLGLALQCAGVSSADHHDG
ncbi:hypothetical protein [Rhodopseudomonas sp. NSM]|uniref:hypothetical protein n=1 Tax=Rhodopseudomonas sp. NSM TaxID=3457630 RepID=UPI0040365BCC